MSRFCVVVLSVLLGVVTVSTKARAQGYPPPASAYGTSPAETHDGLYLRMGLGVGYLQTSASFAGSDLKLSGTAFGLDFALGGAVTPNLVIFGEFAFLSVDSPTVTYGGASGDANGASFDHIGFGPGIAYYIEPANVYLSGALIFGKLQTHESGSNTVTGQTDMGLGANLMVGKEWWVSPQWGLGAALQLMLASNKDGADNTTYSTVGAALAFSATFN